MSKFTNIKVKNGNTWNNLPSNARTSTPATSEGYLGNDDCSSTSFIAGSVTSLDCDNISVRNQRPNAPAPVTVNPTTNTPITITLNVTDIDRDYLIFRLSASPTHGNLTNLNQGDRIPNITGHSAQLTYTPSNTTPESDIIRYTVTDGRQAHSREGVIEIVGPNNDSIPDPIDDFAFTLEGYNITFT